ncbi:hypothetical protein [Microcoleus sp. Pol12B4]
MRSSSESLLLCTLCALTWRSSAEGRATVQQLRLAKFGYPQAELFAKR